MTHTPQKSRCDACGAAYNGCPLHRAAPALVAALEITASIKDTDALSDILRAVTAARAALTLASAGGVAEWSQVVDRARALLRAVEGKETP